MASVVLLMRCFMFHVTTGVCAIECSRSRSLVLRSASHYTHCLALHVEKPGPVSSRLQGTPSSPETRCGPRRLSEGVLPCKFGHRASTHVHAPQPPGLPAHSHRAWLAYNATGTRGRAARRAGLPKSCCSWSCAQGLGIFGDHPRAALRRNIAGLGGVHCVHLAQHTRRCRHSPACPRPCPAFSSWVGLSKTSPNALCLTCASALTTLSEKSLLALLKLVAKLTVFCPISSRKFSKSFPWSSTSRRNFAISSFNSRSCLSSACCFRTVASIAGAFAPPTCTTGRCQPCAYAASGAHNDQSSRSP